MSLACLLHGHTCRAVAAGELGEAVQPWQPWWRTEEAAQLELSQGGTSLVAQMASSAEAVTGESSCAACLNWFSALQ